MALNAHRFTIEKKITEKNDDKKKFNKLMELVHLFHNSTLSGTKSTNIKRGAA